ncbi:MAG: universal stress protein [Candidatus Obscuribacterales bacterium]|nr:universal stress protein [Candidatus Obscuribacterales bacterium]
MVNNSILLPITGSEESLYAAELAWYLAKQTDSKLTAQHVIDTASSLRFLGIEKPGLIGSGPFLAAFDTIQGALRNIANKLEDSYTARVSPLGIQSSFVIDEGDPVEEVCKRADKHTLIVTGHNPVLFDYKQDYKACRITFTQTLVRKSSVPVIIVRRPTNISRFAIFCSMDQVSKNWLKNCLQSARTLGAHCDLTFVASGNNEEMPVDFLQNLKASFPELESEQVRILSSKYGQPAEICDEHIADADNQSLVVLATVNADKQRFTSMGEDPEIFLKRVSSSAVMLWPEEFLMPIFSKTDSAVLASKDSAPTS